MYIIVGLGNPGKRYENTRHNMGFMAIDALAEKYGIRINRLRYSALTGSTIMAGQRVIIAKPQTFMNLSGRSVGRLLDFYKAKPEKLIVLYDDIDLPVGSVRIRKKGSAGTHNGMRSVVESVGSEDFARIRIGIGAGDGDLVSYVTGRPPETEMKLLKVAVERAAEGAACIVEKGIDKAMNEYNVRAKKEEKTGEEKDD